MTKEIEGRLIEVQKAVEGLDQQIKVVRSDISALKEMVYENKRELIDQVQSFKNQIRDIEHVLRMQSL